MNVSEYGNVFRFNVGSNISTSTPTLILEPREGDALELKAADGVTIPALTITVDGIIYIANQYVEYTIKENDICYAGRWRAKLKAKFSPTKELITDYQRFTVLP